MYTSVAYGHSGSSFLDSAFNYLERGVKVAGDIRSLTSSQEPFGGQGTAANPIPLPGIAVEAPVSQERDYTPYLLGLAALVLVWKLAT